MAHKKPVDVQTSNLGSIWTFYPCTRAGEKWITKHLRGETVCEHRYGYDIAIGMLQAGLILQDARSGCFARLPEES